MASLDGDAHSGMQHADRTRLAGLGRRELITGGVGIAVTQALGAGVKAAGPTRKVALEEHFTTPALAKKYVARPTRSDTLFADIERHLADFDDLCLEAMDKAGIGLAVLSVTMPGVQAEADAGFAHLPMQDAAAAGAELERAVKEFGFKGALINGQTNGQYLDADMYLPFLERVQGLDVPIYPHPGDLVDHPAMFAGRSELNGAVWAWMVETCSHTLRLVFGGTFTRFPKLKSFWVTWARRFRSYCGVSIAGGNASSAKNFRWTRCLRYHQAPLRDQDLSVRARAPRRSHRGTRRGQCDVLGRLSL